MSAVTADWTGVTPQWMQTTQPQITSAFLNMTGLGWSGTCTSTGSTGTIIDTGILNPYTSDREWKGTWVRMTGGTSNNLGQIRQVQHYEPTTGALTVLPVLPSATAANDTYELWSTTMRPQVVLNMLDRVTSNYGLGLQTYSLLSEIPDGDMEQTGTTAYAGVNATIAKVTDYLKPGINGKRALEVTTTSAGGYAELAEPLRIRRSSSLTMSAMFTPEDPSVDNTGTFQVINALTGEVLRTLTTTSKTTTRLWQQFGYGNSNANLIQIRVGSEESGVTGRWDDLVISDNQSFLQPLPYWMGTDSAFKEAYYWTPTNSGPGQNEYDPSLAGRRKAVGWRPRGDHFSGGGRMYIEGNAPATTMLLVSGVRFETAWESLTETKRIDLQWAAACLAVNYYTRLRGQFAGSKAKTDEISGFLDYWEREFRDHDNRVRSQMRTDASPVATWGYANTSRVG